jgi:hypothetical protein
MTPDQLKALQHVRDGGEAQRHEINWLQHWGLVDSNKKLTVKGAELLARHEDDERGLE